MIAGGEVILPQLMQQGASHFLNSHVKDASCHLGKDVFFEKGGIIGLHQVEKTSKDMSETTKIGLRTIHCMTKFSREQDLGLSPSYV